MLDDLEGELRRLQAEISRLEYLLAVRTAATWPDETTPEPPIGSIGLGYGGTLLIHHDRTRWRGLHGGSGQLSPAAILWDSVRHIHPRHNDRLMIWMPI